MIRRILVAVDDSPRAPDVVSAALDIARAAHASIRLYNAVTIPPEFPPAAATHGGDPLPVHMRAEATRRLQELSAAARDVPCEIVIENASRAWRAILDAADSYDADLIVLGSHGYDFVDHIIGTNAAKVTNMSHRDVLVVHRRT
jgi:universal stress protein F